MQKVVKFGGSSLANATQFKKVKSIIESDKSRSIVVVSALGKRNKEDHKITDLLYLTAAHLKYNVDAMSVFEIVKNRYYEIKEESADSSFFYSTSTLPFKITTSALFIISNGCLLQITMSASFPSLILPTR